MKTKKILALALSVLLLTGCDAGKPSGNASVGGQPESDIIQEEIMDKADFEAALPAIVKNSVRMKTGGEAESPLSSRFGGSPMLPEGFVWPTYEGTTWDGITAERPLAFLCQINLADAAPYDTEHLLPDHGMLAVFYDLTTQKWGYDPEDRGCVRVFWFEDTDGLTETAPPADVSDFNGEPITIPAYPLTFSSETDVPSAEEYEDPSHIHKLLGYADTIQGDILRECELVNRGYYLGDGSFREKMPDEEYDDAMAHREDWVLLMQIGTIGGYPDFELMWGDMGCVYICIRKDDLAARNFDSVWLVLQCG